MKKMIFRKCHYNVIYSGGHVVTYSCGNAKSKIAFPFACIWSLFLFFSLLFNLEVEPSNYVHLPALPQPFLSSKCTWYILVRTVGETSGLLGIKWNPMGDKWRVKMLSMSTLTIVAASAFCPLQYRCGVIWVKRRGQDVALTNAAVKLLQCFYL